MKLEDLEVYIPTKKPAWNFKDLSGTENKYFYIISRAPNRKNNRTCWNVQCKACGEYCVKETVNLNKHKSCGCLKNKTIGDSLRKDYTGFRSGKIVAVKYAGYSTPQGNAVWECLCDCGQICYIPTNNLTSGHTTSCGCINYSIGANNIKQILDKNNIKYILEFPIYNIDTENFSHPYRFDFLIIDKNNEPNRIIEFDGIQHYQDSWGRQRRDGVNALEKQQQRDKLKNQWTFDNNIPLVRIPYWERDNITLDMIMGDKYLITPEDEEEEMIVF